MTRYCPMCGHSTQPATFADVAAIKRKAVELVEMGRQALQDHSPGPLVGACEELNDDDGRILVLPLAQLAAGLAFVVADEHRAMVYDLVQNDNQAGTS